MSKQVRVIYLTKALTRIAAAKFAQTQDDPRVIQRKLNTDKNKRDYYIFVKILPDDKIILNKRTYLVDADAIKKVERV
jgi:hypothetical protein